jgi:hypothetical protein
VRALYRSRRAAQVLLLALLAVTTASCSANPTTHSVVSSRPAHLIEAGQDHDCVFPTNARARVDWSALENPILSSSSAGEKDEDLLWFGGEWHMLFSYVRYDRAAPGGVYWDIASATSTDLVHWSEPAAWPPQRGTLGVASPEVVSDPEGGFVVTYQSDPGQSDRAQSRLWYRTSPDLVTWSAPHPLAQNLAPEPQDRMIDGSLAWTGRGLVLGYKAGVVGSEQAFEIAWSADGSLNGPWRYVGKPDIVVNGGTVERDEFLTVAGTWRLVATSNELDQPWVFELAGNPDDPRGWLDWIDGHELEVPKAQWDSGPGISSIGFEWANSAFLCNDSAAGGYYYLLYSGSSELTAFDGWGHAKIGIARSRNLVDWQVPG